MEDSRKRSLTQKEGPVVGPHEKLGFSLKNKKRGG
jgi:hypothetical protein